MCKATPISKLSLSMYTSISSLQTSKSISVSILHIRFWTKIIKILLLDRFIKMDLANHFPQDVEVDKNHCIF